VDYTGTVLVSEWGLTSYLLSFSANMLELFRKAASLGDQLHFDPPLCTRFLKLVEFGPGVLIVIFEINIQLGNGGRKRLFLVECVSDVTIRQD
jgi:hypothetical protein